ncbi:hypothetical protein [Streptomyces albipurpureus]|uniref:Secreted protein n=1 Tax=Streptomyces albipurpureus TaxID=2897419 RepID=A0ABT0UUG4_9ACTN|nr:hypothetical protein [Streptomyces sp. CWNU-1]MCM2391270.1 hypothetical protein [Streptomyces sp. CWNU-1]
MTASLDRSERLSLPARSLIVVATLVVLVGGAFLVVNQLTDKVTSDQVKKEKDCCWVSGATPAWTIKLFGLQVPKTATDQRAGYKTGRIDIALLSFVLPRPDAEKYLKALSPEGTKLIGNDHPKEKGYRPTAPFSHLGLPEPETIVTGMRQGGVCEGDVSTPEGKMVSRCIDIFAQVLGSGGTRIYLRSSIEPSATPPAAEPAGS